MPPRKMEAPDPATVSAMAERGENAKRLLGDAYFGEVMQRMDETYKGMLVQLAPGDTAKFTALQERRGMLADLRNALIHDAEAGRKAVAALQGNSTTNAGRVA